MAALRLSRPYGRRGIIALAAVLLIAAYAGWHYLAMPTADAAINPADNSKAQAKGPAPIPATIQRVQSADFPVYLNGLGTVQPYDTVTVRSRVDGQVIKVNFRQGQMVNEGDLLLQIDPRPYQAALDQAQAKRRRTRPLCATRGLIFRVTARWRSKASRRANNSTPSKRRSISSPRRSKATKRPSTTPPRNSATPRSNLHCRARPVSAWSTRATSCMRATRPASSRS